MRKLIPFLFLILLLTSCDGRGIENPDRLSAAVMTVSGSESGERAYRELSESVAATLTADIISPNARDLSEYDIVYIDKSVVEAEEFNKNFVQSFVENGGSVFLDNELYDVFDKDFIGAEDFVTVDSCPLEMQYLSADKNIRRFQELIYDFCGVYGSYDNYEEELANRSYGVCVMPSTAQVLTQNNGLGIYTLNQYGSGYVLFAGRILPNDDSGTDCPATSSANKLIRGYFAEFVSLKKYGYAVERVIGSNARPAAAWELVAENEGAAKEFDALCRRYGQIASYSSHELKESGAQNAITLPSYANGQLVLQPSNTPDGTNRYTHMAAKYSSPLLFTTVCDGYGAEEKIKKADMIVSDYGYGFAQREQLVKMAAASYNTRVTAKWENDTLRLSADTIDKNIPLYDENYNRAVGVKIILADGAADEFGVDANVYYKKDNCIYVSLDGGASISRSGKGSDITLRAVNLPAKISRNKNTAEIEFLDGGMMSVTVEGMAKTASTGWEVTRQDGVTVFRKYGGADTLKIKK